ncbi:PKD domain-containing protein [Phycicoccus sp. BSK3Z-2]|uniref:PKD domain-containing protein n=1 Tax=Phycicoccus avicenniae TaxID=2828860 RepID=A0A941I051_9MICO|nr:PKD domain-containing protein [Phycicoccus avicenniae]MBR7743692.1 PKD domain-containing protein [Phycicoccus avicenniae]
MTSRISRGLRQVGLVVAAAALAVAGAGAPAASAAPDQPAGSIAGDVPEPGTPHVLNGRVYSVVKVGNTMVLGGTFTSARNDNSSTTLSRSRLLAFDATTGIISQTFTPNPNGTVNAVIPAGDGQTVYVGGSFSSIGGVSRNNLARVRVSDGAVVGSFDPGMVTGQVKDLRLADGRLWVAGGFTHLNAGVAQKALATLDPDSGSVTDYFQGVIEGDHNGGYTTVMKLDVTPDGDRLVAIGNFDTLDGVKNHQVFVLDTSGASAAPYNLRTPFYETPCSASFDSYMRDVDISPDGSFFVISTTGAYGGVNRACDSTARFDFANTGTSVQPSWIDNTGGDTTYGVEITDRVVYTGGHARWQNNPFSGDRAGPGAVSRPGIAALDPANGLPYSWNPTRTRGVGLFDFLPTPQGLWAVSDTDRMGQGYFYKGRVARFANDGIDLPAIVQPALPNDVFMAGGTTPAVQKRTFDGTTAGAVSSAPAGSVDWNAVRGAFMLNGEVYTALSNGSFTKQTFNGTTYGSSTQVNGQDALVVLQEWRNDIANMTGLFFDGGRVYYTVAGQNRLYYRYFTPESSVVGAYRFTASTGVSGVDFSTVRGMFVADDTLFWRTADNRLRSAQWRDGFQSGAPVANTAQVVGGGTTWTSRAFFVYQSADGSGVPLPPTAEFGSDCTSLTCTFDAGASTAPGSSVDSYAWTFGDGTTGTGRQVSKTYASGGSFTVGLTVTTADGATATTSRNVTVQRVNQPPTASFTSSCTALACSFDSGGSTDDTGIASRSWSFGDGTGAGNVTAPDHSFAAPGTYGVTLSVTDTDGVTRSVTQDVTVEAAPTSDVAFVAAATENGNSNSHTVAVPSDVQAGDRLLLSFTVNNSNTTVTGPPGWTLVDSDDAGGAMGLVWTKAAGAQDAGSGVTVDVSTWSKGALSVVAYRSDTGTPTVAQSASDTARGTTTVVAPGVQAASGDWVVRFWGVKSSSPISLAGTGGENRSTSTGSGGGGIFSWLTDSDGPVSSGAVAAQNATSDPAVNRAVTVTVTVGTP